MLARCVPCCCQPTCPPDHGGQHKASKTAAVKHQRHGQMRGFGTTAVPWFDATALPWTEQQDQQSPGRQQQQGANPAPAKNSQIVPQRLMTLLAAHGQLWAMLLLQLALLSSAMTVDGNHPHITRMHIYDTLLQAAAAQLSDCTNPRHTPCDVQLYHQQIRNWKTQSPPTRFEQHSTPAHMHPSHPTHPRSRTPKYTPRSTQSCNNCLLINCTIHPTS